MSGCAKFENLAEAADYIDAKIKEFSTIVEPEINPEIKEVPKTIHSEMKEYAPKIKEFYNGLLSRISKHIKKGLEYNRGTYTLILLNKEDNTEKRIKLPYWDFNLNESNKN